jgi:hypothetical protein
MNTTTKPMPETRAELIADMEARAAELETMAAAIAPSRFEPWVVVSAHGIALRFTFEGLNVTGVASTNMENVTTLSRENAEHLAPVTKDGNGDAGRAMTKRQALLDQARESRNVASLLRCSEGGAA